MGSPHVESESSPYDLFSPDEPERVLADRTRRLLDLKFTVKQIDLIVHRTDVVHEVEDLLKRGASREYVIHELRD